MPMVHDFITFIHQILRMVEPGGRKSPCRHQTNVMESYYLLRKVSYTRLQQILNAIYSLLNQESPCKTTFSLVCCLKVNQIQDI